MPSSDIGEVAAAVNSILNLTAGILERADRDGPTKALNEDTTKIQNSFADSNLDDQWAMAYRLLSDVGHPLTPSGSVGDIDKQFRHNALISIAELKYAKQIIARLVIQQNRK